MRKSMYCKKIISIHVFYNTIMITSSYVTSDKIKYWDLFVMAILACSSV